MSLLCCILCNHVCMLCQWTNSSNSFGCQQRRLSFLHLGSVEQICRCTAKMYRSTRRCAAPAFCTSMLEALAGLQRAAALAAVQQALPPMQHMPQLLGSLLAAAPDNTRTVWQLRLSQVICASVFLRTTLRVLRAL